MFVKGTITLSKGFQTWKAMVHANEEKMRKMRLAGVMDICVGLVGRKSENVKKPLVLLLFFEGSRGPRVPQEK